MQEQTLIKGREGNAKIPLLLQRAADRRLAHGLLAASLIFRQNWHGTLGRVRRLKRTSAFGNRITHFLDAQTTVRSLAASPRQPSRRLGGGEDDTDELTSE